MGRGSKPSTTPAPKSKSNWAVAYEWSSSSSSSRSRSKWGGRKGTHAVTLPPPPLFPINHLRELGEVSPRESASQRHGPAGSDWSQQQASPAHYKAVQRTTAA